MTTQRRRDYLAEQDRGLDPLVQVQPLEDDPAREQVTVTPGGNEQLRVIIARGKQRTMGAGFAMTVQTHAARATTNDLGGSAARLLLWAIQRIEYGNEVQVNVTTVMRDLGLSRAVVKRARAELEARGILVLFLSDPGKPRTYVLNPAVAFKGNPDQYEETRMLWDALYEAATLDRLQASI